YLYRLVFFTFLFGWISFVLFGLEGSYTIPYTFGTQFEAVVPYIGYYLFGLLCFGLSYRLTTFNFYKKSYTYTIVSLVVILLEAPFIYLHHETITDIVITFAYVASLNLIVLVASEMSLNFKRIIEN